MKKIFSLLILSFVIVLSASAQDISSALRQAEARFSSGNETGAIELVTKVLQKYPDNLQAKALYSERVSLSTAPIEPTIAKSA